MRHEIHTTNGAETERGTDREKAREGARLLLESIGADPEADP